MAGGKVVVKIVVDVGNVMEEEVVLVLRFIVMVGEVIVVRGAVVRGDVEFL